MALLLLQQYEFEKIQVPEEHEKIEFSKKLSACGVSLMQYARAITPPEIKL